VSSCAQSFCIVIASIFLIHAAAQASRAEDKFKMSGDFRLRGEFDTNRDGDRPDRFRERIRFRAAAKYQVNPYLTVRSRLATGNPDDPNSPHQTLGTLFNRSPINIDWAYVQFRYEHLWINGGKFPHPFKTPGVYSELVWDADVQPEGIAAGYTLRVGDNLKILAIGAEYILREQGNDGDATLGAGQVALNLAQKPIAVTVAGGIYKYFKLDAEDIGAAGLAGIVAGDNAGNAVIDTDADGNLEFESDFTILDTFINLTYNAEISGKSRPIVLSAQFFTNLDANIDKDKGFAAGIRLGNTKSKGDFKLYYNFQLVEQDSVFSAFVQDDFLAATNFQGHLFGVTYRLLDRTDLNLWGLLSKRDEPEGDESQTRLRADLNLSF
jgi:succinate dehydrogenase flavin-adding protein (antitoxin of CptAB toxin-antitoxin module)